MALVDAIDIYFEVVFLNTKNIEFVKLFEIFIKFKPHHLEFLVEIVLMNNPLISNSSHEFWGLLPC